MSGWNAIYNNLSVGIGKQASEMLRIQEQIASGCRVIRASDAPADAFIIMELGARKGALEVYGRNLDTVIDNSDASVTVLRQCSDILTRVEQLLTQGASGTYGLSQRKVMAAEIDSLLEQVVSLANHEFMGKYIFGGSRASSAPYQAVRQDGKIVAVRYEGSDQPLNVPVATGLQYPATLVGKEIFGGYERQSPQFTGNTGAAAGSGTSSVRGDVYLTITHKATTYDGSTGVAPGSSSAAYDTILGGSHTLTIDADARTVRLDDGAAVAYDPSSDADLKLVNSGGDVVYVDMTGLDPALTGVHEVHATATGRMTIDGGLSSVDLDDFTDNQVVTDSTSGAVLFVDASQIERVGDEYVRVGGTYDVFGALITARDTLENKQGLSSSEQTDQLNQAMQAVRSVFTDISRSIAVVGGRLEAMDRLKESLTTLRDQTYATLSGIRDADVAQLATELSRSQVYYQMLLSATARMVSVSLLDYL